MFLTSFLQKEVKNEYFEPKPAKTGLQAGSTDQSASQRDGKLGRQVFGATPKTTRHRRVLLERDTATEAKAQSRTMESGCARREGWKTTLEG